MSAKICYLGDDNLQMAAAYLGGILLHHGLAFDYVPTSEAPPADFLSKRYALYVVSDYFAATFGQAAMSHVARCVEQGSGLAMFGGWVSYYGQRGEYHTSPLAEVLPVVMRQSDDRRNSAQPCLMNKTAEHPILEGLPWDEPPGIGGYNAFEPKPGSQTLLTSVRFGVRRTGGEFRFTRGEESPLLVVGRHGQGRVAALATDVAPHWVGGFVDWGDRRVTQEVGGGSVEIGNWYAEFFRNLLVWAGQL
jgi:uncharacterized membrane protein